MKLQLRYNEAAQSQVHAAIIGGSNPKTWLTTLMGWQLPSTAYECFILPASIQSTDPAGLFIVFTQPVEQDKPGILDPYTRIGTNLFIPIHTALFPQASLGELQSNLLWSKQVFHPVIGLIGFDDKDRIELADLFSPGPQIEMDWSFAHPGKNKQPVFNQIVIEKASAEKLIEEIQKEIDIKPLADILGDKSKKKKNVFSRLFATIKFIGFGFLLGLMKLFAFILPKGEPSNVRSTGLLQKAFDWLQRNIDDLQKRRDDEITRLLDLFDKDSNEALQFALPLNSPYFNRGTQTGSYKLGRRSTNYNGNTLGGGRTVDGWDIGDRYHTLHTKYLAAAQKEIDKKDFKKAAYIYAHLLGDFSSAANVLEQGGHYREAAALYQGHLKNNLAAAGCLERGGLYHEAIELYIEMKGDYDETVGDLYKKIGNDDISATFYNKFIGKKIEQGDYLDASRIMGEKLGDESRAEEALLTGWKNSGQQENCLKKYFSLQEKKENPEIAQRLRFVYKKHTPAHLQPRLLSVLEHLSNEQKEEEAQTTIRNIAYDIVDAQTNRDDLTGLSALKRIIKEDRLLSSDVSRYVTKANPKPSGSKKALPFQLDPAIEWVKAIAHRNQYIIIGLKNGMCQLARVSEYGNIEYDSWENSVERGTFFSFLSAPYYSNDIILSSNKGYPVTRRRLPKNKYFDDALIVYCPVWMHNLPGVYAINSQKEFVRLELVSNSPVLHIHTPEGKLVRSVTCKSTHDLLIISSLHNTLLFLGNYYYTFTAKQLLICSEREEMRIVEFDSVIRMIAASLPFNPQLIILSTNMGCTIIDPSDRITKSPDFFAADLIPVSISFVSASMFLITESKSVSIFKLAERTPELVKTIRIETGILDAFAGGSRNQVVIIEKDGKISFHDLV